MAEAVAGAVAFEAVTTTLEGGAVAGAALARPTMPLKASLTCIGTSPDLTTPESLQRHSHTVNVIDGKAYIFGGVTSNEQLASNEMHIVTLPKQKGETKQQYQCIPPLSVTEDGKDLPAGRAGHTATVVGEEEIAVFGGRDALGEPLEENGTIFIFETSTLQWRSISTSEDGPIPRYGHFAAAVDKDHLSIYGGSSGEKRPIEDSWSFTLSSGIWSRRQQETYVGPIDNMSIAGSTMALMPNSTTELSGDVKLLDMSKKDKVQYDTITFPANPLTPGPAPRKGGGLSAISTGSGRQYLLYFFGEKAINSTSGKDVSTHLSDIWTMQLPSSSNSLSSFKDMAREKLGFSSGSGIWAEVEVKPRTEETATEGKSHPGPRAYFGYDNVDQSSVFLWGGRNPAGGVEGDGWLISLG